MVPSRAELKRDEKFWIPKFSILERILEEEVAEQGDRIGSEVVEREHQSAGRDGDRSAWDRGRVAERLAGDIRLGIDEGQEGSSRCPLWPVDQTQGRRACHSSSGVVRVEVDLRTTFSIFLNM